MKPLGPRFERLRELSRKTDPSSIQEAAGLQLDIQGDIELAKADAPPALLKQLEGFEQTLRELAVKRTVGSDDVYQRPLTFGGVPSIGSNPNAKPLGIGGLSMFTLQQQQLQLTPSKVTVVFNEPKLRPLDDKDKVAAGGARVAAFVRPHVREHVLDFNYDSQVFALEFLDALNKRRESNPDASAAEVFLGHNPRSAEILKRSGGSHCVGLSIDLVEKLRDTGIPAEVGAAEIPGSAARFGHAFAFVPFEDPKNHEDRGVVIMDPGLNLPEPIVVRPDEPGQLVLGEGEKKQTWTFTLDEETGKISVKRELKKGVEESEWNAVAWDNPDDALSYLSSSSQKLKQVSRDENGEILAATILDFKRRQLTVRVGDEQTRIPFDEVSVELEKIVTHDLAHLLGFAGAGPLKTRLQRLVDAEPELVETQELVKKSAEERQ